MSVEQCMKCINCMIYKIFFQKKQSVLSVFFLHNLTQMKITKQKWTGMNITLRLKFNLILTWISSFTSLPCQLQYTQTFVTHLE